MRIPQSAERFKEAPGQVLRAVLSKDAPAQQALRGVLSKDAPQQALRAVFSGVGQVLLVTEKVRRRAMGGDQETATPVAAADTRTAAGTVTAEKPPSGVKTAEPKPAAKPAARKSAPSKASDGKASPSTAKASAPRARTTKKAGTTKASTAKASTAKASTAKASTAKASTEKASASTPKSSTPKADAPKASSATASAAETSTAKTAATASSTPEPAGALPIPHYSELSMASLRARMRGLDVGQLSELVSYERAHEDRDTVIGMFERRIAKLQQEGPAAAG